MQATSLRYTPLAGGPRTGLLALELVLGPGRSVRPAALVREMELAADSVGSRPKLLSLEISNVADLEDKEMEVFLRLLRDKGFAVHLKTSGQEYRPWFDLCPYRVAEITEIPWPGWTAQEIWYYPEDGTKPEEPEIGENNKNSWKGILVTRGMTISSLIDFHKAARHVWATIQAPLRQFILDFWREA